MADFLLEIYGEELPSSAQNLIENQFEKLLSDIFRDLEINCKELKTFSTSRRVVIYINGLPLITNVKEIEVKGPQINANEKAINGFLKSNNLKKVEQLEIKEISGKSYFIFKKKSEATKIPDVLAIQIPKLLRSIKWIKSMRWGKHKDRWIRPIKNILCVFDNKPVKFEFANLFSNQFSFGNYNFAERKFKFIDYKNYKKKLKENNVILERELREEKILNVINNYCKKNCLIFEPNSILLKRVSDSVENPNVFFGSFSSDFFKIPEFLLINIMTNKQDYFFFKDNKNNLSKNFAFITGIQTNDQSKIIQGNQNVLKARFNDASFFIQEDKKKSLRQRLNQLKEIIFYDKTGSLYDRALRVDSVVKFIYKSLGLEVNQFSDYLLFFNSDLTTELVKEFPNLQGKVGGYLADLEKFPKIVSQAFFDQYEYEFSNNYKNFLTFILSIAQKFDSILGYFASKEDLSGAGDPFGIRRSVLSIIKICIEQKIKINFCNLFNFHKNLYLEKNIKLKIEFKFLYDFFKKRIAVLFSEMGFRQDIIRASMTNELDPFSIFQRVNKMTLFYNSKDGNNFLKAFKRLNSLTEELKYEKIKTNLLEKQEEKNFYNLFNDFKDRLEKRDYDLIFENSKYLNNLTKTIDDFFNNVIVNDENIEIRKNRKILINQFHKILNENFKFSFLEI